MSFEDVYWDGDQVTPTPGGGGVTEISVNSNTTILANQLLTDRNLIIVDNSLNSVNLILPLPSEISGKAIIIKVLSDPYTNSVIIYSNGSPVYNFLNTDENIELIADSVNYTICY